MYSSAKIFDIIDREPATQDTHWLSMSQKKGLFIDTNSKYRNSEAVSPWVYHPPSPGVINKHVYEFNKYKLVHNLSYKYKQAFYPLAPSPTAGSATTSLTSAPRSAHNLCTLPSCPDVHAVLLGVRVYILSRVHNFGCKCLAISEYKPSSYSLMLIFWANKRGEIKGMSKR